MISRNGMANMDFKAIVLAAGLGERLRPLTDAIPKPLMPVAPGEAIITRTLRALESWGVREIAVNLHWQSGPLRDYLAKWNGPATITLSYEPIILGTGGAIRPLRDFIGGAPFWLVNGDIVFDLDPAPIIGDFARKSPLAVAWLTPRRGPRTVETDSSGAVTTFRSKRPGTPGTATFCGVQLVSPRIFDHLPAKDAFSIIEAYENGIRTGETVIGRATRSGRWNDAGTPDRLLEVKRQLDGAASKGAKKRRAVSPPLPRYPFEFTSDPRAPFLFSAFDWSDPALAPTLSAMGWPLAKTRVEPLGGKRGSDRAFLRLHGPHGASAVYARHGGVRAENNRYAGHSALLRDAGVPVPEILADLPQARALAMEDVGDLSLEVLVSRDPTAALDAYGKVIDAIALMHSRGAELARSRGVGLEPPLDMEGMHWEHALFEKYMAKTRIGMDGLPREVRAELEDVASRLAKAPQALIHRDLQSSNVFCRPDGSIRLIDFQGMRFGPAAYDLASLFCDAYVTILDDAAKERLLARYAENLPGTGGIVKTLFPYAAIQRLVQALGAFGRLSGLGIARFAAFIPPASRTLAEMAERCGYTALLEIASQCK